MRMMQEIIFVANSGGLSDFPGLQLFESFEALLPAGLSVIPMMR